MEQKKLMSDKIMVKAPYNILFDLQNEVDGSISGKVKNEFLLPNEHGPISAAEAGRHLAILGSIALSNISDTTKYYLAIQAEITRETLSINDSGDILYVQSKVVSQDNRIGIVSGSILDHNNTIIYHIIVKYQILNISLFSKLFKNFKNTSLIQNEISPYIHRKTLSNIIIEGDEISGVYGIVQPAECEGHFKDFPALPVAIICNSFTELGLELFLHHSTGSSKAIATHATINASRLVFSGEHLSFKGSKVIDESTSTETITVYFEALVNSKKVADAIFEIHGTKEEN